MDPIPTLAEQVTGIDKAVLQDLIQRTADLDNACRAIAEKAGQLYMRADAAGLDTLTGLLDKPMRNASDNQQTFAGVVAELRTQDRADR